MANINHADLMIIFKSKNKSKNWEEKNNFSFFRKQRLSRVTHTITVPKEWYQDLFNPFVDSLRKNKEGRPIDMYNKQNGFDELAPTCIIIIIIKTLDLVDHFV
jgi:ABC-type long-subunit fatty acid transport system fused permease/ATPase subunit